MKLILKNFKCYENKYFEFDKGFNLIEGQSGAGKTTILNAILFVLYGKGKNLKLYGKTTCSVQLEMDNLIIFRSKSPNRLIVNNNLEDDEAQNLINKYFGENFEITSYISQSYINSFILMNPTEKLEFLEKLAFKDINLKDIKNRNKIEITNRKEELIKTINSLELTKNLLQEIVEPIEVKFPLKGKKENYEKLSKNEEIKLKNCNVRIKRANIEIKKLEEEINDIKILNNYINIKEENIDSLTEYLSELVIEEKNKFFDELKLIEYKDRLTKLQSKNELINKQIQYDENLKKLEEMKETEVNKYKKEIEKITNILWKEYSKEEAENLIKDTKEFLEDAKKVTFLNKQINEIKIDENILKNNISKLEKDKDNYTKKNILLEQIKNKKNIYKCPECNNQLLMSDNKLIIYEEKDCDLELEEEKDLEILENEISILKNNISKLEKKITNDEIKLEKEESLKKEIEDILSSYEDDIDENTLEDDLINITNYFNYQIKQENKKNELENILIEEKFSSSYNIFEKDNKKLKIEIEKLENISGKNEEELTEENLRELIIIEEKNKENIERINKDKRKKENEKIKYIDEINTIKNNHLNKYESINNIDDIETKISENKNIIEQNEKDKRIHEKNLEEIQKYNKYIEEYTKYNNFKEKIKELETQEKNNRKKYEASVKLKEKILEAESIAIVNIIEVVNNHSQIYLDYFFPDNPILVKLLSFKETKKDNKPQVNVEIDYKGSECDLASLSGGELSRVILAFTLALCEIFNSPILLLDECTSSLDQEFATIVFDAIKENFKDKLILIIAHQVISGIFDSVIQIK